MQYAQKDGDFSLSSNNLVIIEGAPLGASFFTVSGGWVVRFANPVIFRTGPREPRTYQQRLFAYVSVFCPAFAMNPPPDPLFVVSFTLYDGADPLQRQTPAWARDELFGSEDIMKGRGPTRYVGCVDFALPLTPNNKSLRCHLSASVILRSYAGIKILGTVHDDFYIEAQD